MGKKRRASGSLLGISAVGKPGVAGVDESVMATSPEGSEGTAAAATQQGANRKKKRRKKNNVPVTAGPDNNESDKLAETAVNESHGNGNGNGKHTTPTAETESEEEAVRPSRGAEEERTQTLSENQNTNRLIITSKTGGGQGQGSSSDSCSTFSLAAKLPSNLEYLHKKYSFGLIEISTNSRYNTLVKSVIKLLSPSPSEPKNPNDPNDPNAPTTKPPIVLLESKAECAPRLIAIVEAVKVHIAATGENWFQYNGLRGEILPFKPKPKRRRGAENTTIDIEGKKERNSTAAAAKVTGTGQVKNNAAEDDMDLDEEDAFQTMVRGGADDLSARTTSLHGKDKVRSVPIITILIARLLVPELAGSYW